MHISYTAREGGSILKSHVNDHLNANLNKVLDELAATGSGFLRVFSLKNEFPDEFYELQSASSGTTPSTSLKINHRHFPFLVREREIEIEDITLVIKPEDGAFSPQELMWKIVPSNNSSPADEVNLVPPNPPIFVNDDRFGGLLALSLFGSHPNNNKLSEIKSFDLSLDFTPEEVEIYGWYFITK